MYAGISEFPSPNFCTSSSLLYLLLSIQRMQNPTIITPLWERGTQISTSVSGFWSLNQQIFIRFYRNISQHGGNENLQTEGLLNSVYSEFYLQTSRASQSITAFPTVLAVLSLQRKKG